MTFYVEKDGVPYKGNAARSAKGAPKTKFVARSKQSAVQQASSSKARKSKQAVKSVPKRPIRKEQQAPQQAPAAASSSASSGRASSSLGVIYEKTFKPLKAVAASGQEGELAIFTLLGSDCRSLTLWRWTPAGHG
eukprot:TRINITY_DN67018_c0_g1_i1.p1 TRINITY_DN67018_c0_g1~~TRINITY_DN67018_c0_g1_i1.p1  ORF type:complete len:135 (-),score=24.85 TRINITY_DN67018_c0_g1_i1:70-474(-)